MRYLNLITRRSLVQIQPPQPNRKALCNAMGKWLRNPQRLHGAFLVNYTRFFEVCQAFFAKIFGLCSCTTLFCPLGNYDGCIGLCTSANTSAADFLCGVVGTSSSGSAWKFQNLVYFCSVCRNFFVNRGGQTAKGIKLL